MRLKLLPCPFCGTDDVDYSTSMSNITHHIFCSHCYSKGSDKHTRNDAAEAWNHRSNVSEESNHTPISDLVQNMLSKIERLESFSRQQGASISYLQQPKDCHLAFDLKALSSRIEALEEKVK
jgi:Lar family restriction alleviation protein